MPDQALAGPRTADDPLTRRYAATEGTVLLTAVQALARLCLEQAAADRARGLRTGGYVSGYQGSPLAGFDMTLDRMRPLLDAAGVVHAPGLNEELAATAVLGTQQLAAVPGTPTVDGVFALWYGKAPGLDRAMDALRHGNLAGAAPLGGVVVAVGDDPVSKSSTVASDSSGPLVDLGMPVLVPSDAAEVLDLGLAAYEMSRRSGTWVGLRLVTDVADGAGTVALPRPVAGRLAALPAELTAGHRPTTKFLGPGPVLLERSLWEKRLVVAAAVGEALGLNEAVVAGDDDTVGVLAVGKAYLDVRGALERLGLDDDTMTAAGVRLVHVRMPSPLRPDAVRGLTAGLRHVLVVEEKRGLVEGLVRQALYGQPGAPTVAGKTTPDGSPLLPAYGQLDADTVGRALAGWLRAAGVRAPAAVPVPAAAAPPAGATTLPLAARTPYFCSGCPHNTGTKVPAGTLVGAGIGCHGMAAIMPAEHVGTVLGLTQMGGEGVQWLGLAPFVDVPHFTQNMGDGTFAHSGSLAIRAAVAAGADVTYKILLNSAVAMTGGQQVVGAQQVAALASLLLAEGVREVAVTTEDRRRYRGVRLPRGVRLHDRAEIVEVQERLREVPGVTVLVHDQECAAELRRKRKRGLVAAPAERVVISERVCEGCGDCAAASNCLSLHPVATEYGDKTRIDQHSCNLDRSCVDGDCPSFVTVRPGTGRTARRVSAAAGGPPPEPERPPLTDAWNLRVSGIGGSGVITIAQVLATAALFDGRQAHVLDQTGLAQKGGPVVSDLRISAGRREAAPRLGTGECDVHLVTDLVVGADAQVAAVMSPQRTRSVVSTPIVPTGSMVRGLAPRLRDAGPLLADVEQRSRWTVALDGPGLAEQATGSAEVAGVLLVGVAYQAGLLPVTAASIERALEVNGVAVERNVAAFRAGRRWLHDRDGAEVGGVPDGGDPLAELVARRAADLRDYQDAAYARRYDELVRVAREAEARVDPASRRFALAVAQGFHKLLAYKDEYEVARLHLADRERIREQFGADARVTWHLHPPLLRALGLKRKVASSTGYALAFHVLKAGRRVRGTALDPFGHTRVRRTERALAAEYEQLVRDLAAGLTASSSPAELDRAAAVAALPDLVRGYEEIKLRNVERYRARLAELTGDRS